MKVRILKFFATISIAFLASCGGGSKGGTLYISVSYPTAAIALYTASTITPTLSGFQGHTPQCSLATGSVGTGMTLNGSCTITGTPTQAGTSFFSVRVGASDATGSITVSGSVQVRGPSITYVLPASPKVGNAANILPTVTNWTAPSGLATTWSYQLISALPPGLTLNTTTGAITGTYTTAGIYSSSVRGTMTTIYGTYTATDSTIFFNVAP